MHAVASETPDVQPEPADLHLQEVGVLPIVLPQHDTLRAVEEAAFWLQAYRQGLPDDAQRAYEVVEQVDTLVQPHRLRLMRDYLSQGGRMQTYRQRRIWRAAVSYANELALAYGYCLRPLGSDTAPKATVANIAARAMRAGTLELRWALLAYASIDPTLWGRLGRLYRDCERTGLSTLRFKVYPQMRGASTVRREYLRALVLAVSGMSNLLPAAQAVAERIVAALAEFFMLRHSPAPGCHFVVDIDQGSAPRRGHALRSMRDSHRYFGPGDATAMLTGCLRRMRESGELPPELGLSPAFDVPLVMSVLEHLTRYWAAQPPERGEERTPVLATMHAAAGVDVAFAAVCGERPEEATESWIVADESRQGLGVVVRARDDDTLAIGQLVAIRPERPGAWAIGVIRRIEARDALYRSVGLHLLGRGAVAAAIGAEASQDLQPAILLPVPGGDPAAVGEVVLVLRVDKPLHHAPILHLHGHRYRIELHETLASGEGFEAVRCALVEVPATSPTLQ